ncbi:CZB domain-containing protein [Candidatus Symbiobacter mobilis]|uniref:Chemoreceptor zinc-binding domain-containing protein n=1 Tax=Candidatus Symbiobacter mobilis CR TaxID=946483 RepID=U5N899_9BURK|nr:CZB domain-containing protein [Candidatus Symbiobacter mobilis]AGX87627.1 hypothetical protein Cenrod_1542 [Candidatus Symbiobacter mobilis CR]
MNDSEKKEKINAAISAHFAWFGRIKNAIATGKSEFNPDVVKADSKCEFGQWIYSDMRGMCPNEKVFQDIRTTHAEFHKLASEALSMALSGQQAAATNEIAPSGKLTILSGKLVLLLRQL